MQRMRWAKYLWPGLPNMLSRGSWSSLAVALIAAGLLDLALLSTFAWTELISPNLRIVLWLGIIAIWSAAAAFSWLGRNARTQSVGDEAIPDSMIPAINYYLRGNWVEAERHLSTLLRRNSRDTEARLMLATLYRHTSRRQEAAAQLQTLERFEGAGQWRWEIDREKQLLQHDETDGQLSGPAEQPDNLQDHVPDAA